jgi:hypothetical protein
MAPLAATVVVGLDLTMIVPTVTVALTAPHSEENQVGLLQAPARLLQAPVRFIQAPIPYVQRISRLIGLDLVSRALC